MTEIKVIGPTRERIFAWEDPETGEVHPEHWVNLMIAEAVGTDGHVYGEQVTCGIEVGIPGVTEMREYLPRQALKRRMKNLGVWAE